MKPETRLQLNAINAAFYRAIAEDFSETRANAWLGWKRAFDALAIAPEATPSVLDVGCGNGRFARFLDSRLGSRFHYLGVDSNAKLLELARDQAPSRPDVRFEARNVIDPLDRTAIPDGPFDLIVLFGLLHHVPGLATRQTLLADCAKRLAPGGHLVVAAWRFGAFERFRRRFIAWEDYNAALENPAQRVDIGDLEPGDHLLGWRDVPSPRYCHDVDRSEFDQLLEGLGLTRRDRFDADGKTGDLNDYAIMQRV